MYKAHRSFETPLESLEAGLEAVEVAEAQKKNKKKKYCRHGGLNPGPLDCEQSLLTITPRRLKRLQRFEIKVSLRPKFLRTKFV